MNIHLTSDWVKSVLRFPGTIHWINSTFLFYQTENKRTAKRYRDEAVIIVTSFLPLFYVHNKGCKGWRSGENARLPLMWPGFKSRRRRHMWVEFVVNSFSPGTPVFPSPQKPTFLFHSTRNQIYEEPLCGCATSNSLFIYLFIYLCPQCKVSCWRAKVEL